jgi:hypothetical protein
VKSNLANASIVVGITITILLVAAAASSTTTTSAVYAQTPLPPLTTSPPLLGEIGEGTTVSDRIEAAETNTDIDIQRISDMLEKATAQVIILQTSASVRDDSAFSVAQAELSDAMWQIRLEISYVTPEQVELVNGLDEQSEGENRELNVTFVDETATEVQSNSGTLSDMYMVNELTENNIEQITSRILEQLGDIKEEITFSVPLDEVEIIGAMTVPIEELRELEAQSNTSSDLILE